MPLQWGTGYHMRYLNKHTLFLTEREVSYFTHLFLQIKLKGLLIAK